MEHNWCRECGRVGHTVMHFMPPPACTKPAVSVCWDCARSDARYYWWYKTYAEKEFFLDDDDLSALRVWVTASPLNRGCVHSPCCQRSSACTAASDERMGLSTLFDIAPQVRAVQAVPGGRLAGASGGNSSNC